MTTENLIAALAKKHGIPAQAVEKIAKICEGTQESFSVLGLLRHATEREDSFLNKFILEFKEIASLICDEGAS